MAVRRDRIPSVKGVSALVPDEAESRTLVEQVLSRCARDFGYRELRLPLLERTELFTRSIGEATDIVHKEMFSFQLRGKDSLSLRPEGTAGAVRSMLELSLADRRPARFWYCGPMFRYERPQKGRSRQFDQFGIEAFGMSGVEIEFEILSLCAAIWRALGLEGRLQLQISSLGDESCRQRHKKDLLAYFAPHRDSMGEEARQRMQQNPLRLLDSKEPALQQILQDAPLLPDYLDTPSAERFDTLCRMLDEASIAYQINPRLVRGLDYYTHTVFEWVAADGLGGQDTLCAGGRYDGLPELLGGAPTAAVGFALGLERLMLVLQAAGTVPQAAAPHFFVVSTNEQARRCGLKLAGELRRLSPGAGVETYCGDAGLASQMKQADASGAAFVLLIGQEEIAAEKVRLKVMADGGEHDFSRHNLRAMLDWVQAQFGELADAQSVAAKDNDLETA